MKVTARRVNVEQPYAVGSRVRKCVQDADRRTDVRAGSEAKPFVLDEELRLSFEHVERIDVVVVSVGVGPFEAGLELELDQGQLLSADLDRRDSVLPLETFAFAGRQEDGVRSREPASGRCVDAVEAPGLTAISLLQIPCKTTIRRMEVEEPRPRSAPEPVDDLPWSADAGAWGQHPLLVIDQDSEPSLEDVKRIRVFTVEVRIRSGTGIREKRLGDAELAEVRLDDDPSAEKRLALAGSLHDSWHFGRV